MSFLSNVKYRYQTKILDDLLEKNHKDFIDYLLRLKKDKQLYYSLASKYVPAILAKNEVGISEPKIIWLNSFLRDDLQYVESFLNFYIQKTTNRSEEIQDISSEFLKVQNYFSISEKIDFDKIVQCSLFYQWLLSDVKEKNFHIITNLISFFSTEGGYNFTTPKLSKCFLFIVDHPYSVFAKIKNKHDGDSDKAKQLMFNIDGQNIIESKENYNFCPVQQPWHIHLSSWQDPNVIDSLKGKIINLNDLFNNPMDTLSSIVFHFIQSGLLLDMKYDLVEEFIKYNNPKNHISIPNHDEISNHDKKFIKNSIREYDFSFFDL